MNSGGRAAVLAGALLALAFLALAAPLAGATSYRIAVLHSVAPYDTSASSSSGRYGAGLCYEETYTKVYRFYMLVRGVDYAAIIAPVMTAGGAVAAVMVYPNGTVSYADIVVALGAGRVVPVDAAIVDTYGERWCSNGTAVTVHEWRRVITITYNAAGQAKTWYLYYKPYWGEPVEPQPWNFFAETPKLYVGVVAPVGANVDDPLVYAGPPPSATSTTTTADTATTYSIPRTPEPEPAPTFTIINGTTTTWITPNTTIPAEPVEAPTTGTSPGTASPGNNDKLLAAGIGVVFLVALLALAKR
jgi:hypothetical protein